MFEEKQIDYEFVNVKKQPIEKDQLQDIINQLGVENVVNSKGPTYRKLGLKESNPTDKELFDILLKEQGMIKRPLIEKDGKYWGSSKGFDADAILEFISTN